MPVDWQVEYGPSLGNTLSGHLYDVYTKRAFNRFANEAKIWLDDPDGNLDSTFQYGTKVQLSVKRNIDASFSRNFAGYVAGTPERDREKTVVDILSFDSFLRQRTVNRGYSSRTVSFILEDLITALTPIQWASGANVSVENDVTLTREFRGAKLDKVINELSNISGTDAWGANFDNEFYFYQPGNTTAPTSLVDGTYYDATISEDGKKAVFKVVLYYGDVTPDGSTDNRDVVEVNQLDEQQDLGDKLGSDAVVIELPKYYPQISSKDAAKRKARDILQRHSALLVGEVEGFEGFDCEPGQVIPFEYPERGIDTQFRIAQIEHRWLDDRTTWKLAENETGVLDTLVSVSDEVARLDARGQDTTAVADQSVPLSDTLELKDSLKVTKREYGVDPYNPPRGDQVNIVLDSSYTAPGNTAVNDSMDLKGNQTGTTVIIDK